jgi:hypothetical protein
MGLLSFQSYPGAAALTNMISEFCYTHNSWYSDGGSCATLLTVNISLAALSHSWLFSSRTFSRENCAKLFRSSFS